MDARRSNWTERAGALGLAIAIAAVVLGGCASSDAGSWEGSMEIARMMFGAGQNDDVTQGNAQKATNALAHADQQTCAAAAPYRAAAAQAAAPVAALAEESAGIRADFQMEMAQQDLAGRVVAQASSQRDRAWAEFVAARDALDALSTTTRFDAQGRTSAEFGQARSTATVGEVWSAMDVLFDRLRDVSRDLQAAAEDLRFALQTTEGSALATAGDPNVDIAATLDALVADATALNDRWIGFTQDEVSLPSDRSTTIGAMDGSDRDALDGLLRDLLDASRDANTVYRDMTGVFGYLDGVQQAMTNRRAAQTARTTDIANETGRLAAEATRNAWLAVGACGGTVPPEYAEWVANPFDDYAPIPQWNSTFWDISSP
ncbi:MAG: hypothetical protein R3E88_01725 [Myxococcota bacterium]